MPIAYRKIPKEGGGGGKCNIDFSKDAIEKIQEIGDCVAIALDIKGFFENLSHSIIKNKWCELLKVDRLPPDHFALYRNITSYRYVDQRELYRRLGYLDVTTEGGRTRERYTRSFDAMPLQLCSPKDFREKVCGDDPRFPSLIRKNSNLHGEPLDHGIPQGAPISDLIANFYLMEFDEVMNNYAVERGGVYYRYSDDILLIIPGGEAEASHAEDIAMMEIQKYGDEIKIKEEKTCIVKYNRNSGRLHFAHLKGPQGKNGFEYLGFRFDGENVYLRDSTLSRLYRKVAISAKGAAYSFAAANKGKTADQLIAEFNFSKFSQQFSRVTKDELFPDDYRTWTFYSYLKRASDTFGPIGAPIMRQARNFKRIMRDRVEAALNAAVE